MWIGLLNTDGALEEKRKIASSAGDEHLNDIKFIGNNKVLFVGIEDPTGSGNIIFGETYYDSATIEVNWSRKFSNTAYRYSNPNLTVDDYGTVYITATATTVSTGKTAGVAYWKFLASNLQTPATQKLFARNTAFEEIQSTGVRFDLFGNIDVGAYVRYAFNDNRIVAWKVSWNTDNVITAASVKETSGIGFHPVAITNDSSADTIVVGNKVEANEIAILNFDTDVSGDDTYNDISTIAWKGTGEVIDDTKPKFGNSSVTTTAAANALEIDWAADQGTDWTIEGYIAIGQSQYNAQSSQPNLF